MKQGFAGPVAFTLLAALLTNTADAEPAALPSPTLVPIVSTPPLPSTSPVASALPVPSGLPVPSANPAAGSNLRATVDWSLSTAQIRDNCSAAIARAHQEQLALDALPLARATFATVVVPLEDISADLNDETIAETFLTNVSPQKDVRDASLACNTDEGTFSNEFSADPRLYALVDAARRSNTAGNVYDRKLLALWETALFRSGGALPPKQRAEFVRLSDRLTDLTNAFGNNLANDQSTIVATSGELADVPSDQVSGWTKKPDGTIVVPVNESTYALFYGNVKSEAARKRYYFAYNNRAVVNVKLLREALVVRYQLTHLLGYPSWDAYQLADRMPKTPARLARFLDDLETHLRPLAAKDMAELAAVKAEQEHVSHATLEPWDTFYEQQYLLRTKYAVDENLVRQYFPVQHTIDAV